MIRIFTLFSYVSGSTLPPDCPFENSPFHAHQSNIHDPWPGQQIISPRSSSSDGRDDLPWLTDNLLPITLDANSPANHVEGVDLFHQPAVQKWEMSSNIEPQWEQIFLDQGLSNTENTHTLPQSINAPSSQNKKNMNNLNHTDPPMGQSALYFKEFFKGKVAAREKLSMTPVTTKTPATNTTSAVSTQTPASPLPVLLL